VPQSPVPLAIVPTCSGGIGLAPNSVVFMALPEDVASVTGIPGSTVAVPDVPVDGRQVVETPVSSPGFPSSPGGVFASSGGVLVS